MVAALQHMRERKLITEQGGRWQMSLPLDEVSRRRTVFDK